MKILNASSFKEKVPSLEITDVWLKEIYDCKKSIVSNKDLWNKIQYIYNRETKLLQRLKENLLCDFNGLP